MRTLRDTTPLEELHPELRSRVRAASGHATEVEVIPDGAGYRITTLAGDTVVKMYLEMRPDGSVEERTQLRRRSQGSPWINGGSPIVMNLEKLSDEELMDRLRTALAEVVMFGEDDQAGRREAWQRVIDGIRDLERRYPPESGELA